MLAFSGFLLDWLITRDWRRVGVSLFVLVPATVLIVCSLWGVSLNRDGLAGEYLRLGERELNDATDGWAFQGLRSTKLNEETDTVSRYTEALFRRAKSLQSSNPRTTFVIGALIAQRGGTAQAVSIMELLAPDNRVGHLPAHAWLADFMLRKGTVPEKEVPRLRHHVEHAVKWEQVPAKILAAATQFALQARDNSRAIELLAQSAEKQPEFEAELFRLALQLGNMRVAEQAAEKALPRLLALVESDRATVFDRLALSEILAYKKQYEAAQAAIEDGLKAENLSESNRQQLARGLSEFFRRRYTESLTHTPLSWTADLKMLDRAMRADPTNPLIAEEVAKLARIGQKAPPDELMAKLQDYLARGVATPVTHTWLAEAYIIRENYDKAITHLENVVRRLPDAAHSHNNLAYALALSSPDRLPDALSHARSAVSTNPKEADFHDTLGYVLMEMGQLEDAIPAMETAIELAPNRPDFHTRLADAYSKKGEKSLAEAHQRVANQLKQSQEKQINQSRESDDNTQKK